MNLIIPRDYLNYPPYCELDGLEAMAILFMHTEANILGMVYINPDVYLKSDRWMNLREKAIQRHGSVCHSCGSASDIQVHHLRYSNLYDVTVDDLQVLCRSCHFREHNPPKKEPEPDDSFDF